MNWGTDQDVILDGKEKALEETDGAVVPAVSNLKCPLIAQAVEAEAPKDDEPKQVSLEEFLRQKSQRSVPLPAARKAGEGEDASRWGDAQELVKEDEDEENASKVHIFVYRFSYPRILPALPSPSDPSRSRPLPLKSSSLKKAPLSPVKASVVAVAEVSCLRSSISFVGRGGRGGNRGGRGGNTRTEHAATAGAGSKVAGAGFKVDDSDFPSL
jgi:hypothetical protein